MVTAKDVKELRDQTGAPMMDCKKALSENDGDMEKAVQDLRVRGIDKGGKRRGKERHEGLIASYIHPPGKIGVLVEIACETDFVARNEEMKEFASQVAMHIASAAPEYLKEDEIPEEAAQAEYEISMRKAEESGKPPEIAEKMVNGQMNKWKKSVSLMNQVHVNTEKHESRTIEEIQTEISAKMGEKITINRFARFAI